MKYVADAPNPAAWLILIVAIALGAFLFYKWAVNNYEAEQTAINKYWEDQDLVF